MVGTTLNYLLHTLAILLLHIPSPFPTHMSGKYTLKGGLDSTETSDPRADRSTDRSECLLKSKHCILQNTSSLMASYSYCCNRSEHRTPLLQGGQVQSWRTNRDWAGLDQCSHLRVRLRSTAQRHYPYQQGPDKTKARQTCQPTHSSLTLPQHTAIRTLYSQSPGYLHTNLTTAQQPWIDNNTNGAFITDHTTVSDTSHTGRQRTTDTLPDKDLCPRAYLVSTIGSAPSNKCTRPDPLIRTTHDHNTYLSLPRPYTSTQPMPQTILSIQQQGVERPPNMSAQSTPMMTPLTGADEYITAQLYDYKAHSAAPIPEETVEELKRTKLPPVPEEQMAQRLTRAAELQTFRAELKKEAESSPHHAVAAQGALLKVPKLHIIPHFHNSLDFTTQVDPTLLNVVGFDHPNITGTSEGAPLTDYQVLGLAGSSCLTVRTVKQGSRQPAVSTTTLCNSEAPHTYILPSLQKGRSTTGLCWSSKHWEWSHKKNTNALVALCSSVHEYHTCMYQPPWSCTSSSDLGYPICLGNWKRPCQHMFSLQESKGVPTPVAPAACLHCPPGLLLM